jgi:hypothetical protein
MRKNEVAETNAKPCRVSFIVPGTETLPPCARPAVKTCEDCGRGFCEDHVRGSMVGDLCRACLKPE